MSRGGLVTMVAVLVLGAAVAGLFLWERSGDRRSADSEPRAERLLIGLNPQTVRRVRFRYGDRTVELVRQFGSWEPSPGSTGSSTVRVDVLLQHLATLRVRLATGKKASGRRLGRPLADIKVWRGRARPVIVRLYGRGRRVMLTTTDRPGIYHADSKLLQVLRRELQQPQLPPLWPLRPLKLASVEVVTKTSVTLVRRSGRWFLEDSAALAPADSAAVGRLLRTLGALRVTHQLGQGTAAVNKHGLDKPRVTVRVDDGTKRTLRLGGPCPRSKAAVVATLGGKKPAVVCVTRPDPKSLTGPFVSTRLFSLSADEIKAIRVTRSKRSLALTHHPGSGGWKMTAPEEGLVDQVAAASLVADMARLDGQPPPRPTSTSAPLGPNATAGPPETAKRVGSVVLTPLVGSEERVALHAAGDGQGLWARRMGGTHWLRVRAKDARLLTADPVLLRSRNLCSEPGKKILNLAKTHPGRVTELLMNQRGSWQLVLLAGRLSLTKAARIGAKLGQYRPAAKQGTTAAEAMVWKRPVLLVANPDRVHLSTLLHHLKAIRAQSFVSSQARGEHGFGRQSLRLTYVYMHSCKSDAKGKPQCQQARCAIEVGGPRDGGGCFARQINNPANHPVNSRAVFVASAALCRAVRTPLANRRAISVGMHLVTSITLRRGGKVRRLPRAQRGGWKRPAEVSALSWEAAAGALLQLAPLNAQAVGDYGRSTKMGRRELTVVLTVKEMPQIQLDFYVDESNSKSRWMVRKGLPMRYKVPTRMVRGLQRLAGFNKSPPK